MKKTGPDRIPGLMAEGWRLLGGHQAREAADLFGRVLLRDPTHEGAREGLARARVMVTEADRVLEADLDEAGRAMDTGEHARARNLLERVLSRGGDRDRARALLDRLDPRSGSVAAIGPLVRPHASDARARPASPAPWSRGAFVAASALLFAALAAGVGASWERLLVRLARTPSPTSLLGAPETLVPVPTPGERAVAEARRLMQEGDWPAALAVLDGVPADEPAYPFARQLRSHAQAVLRDRGGVP